MDWSPDEFEVEVFTNLNRRDFAKAVRTIAEAEIPPRPIGWACDAGDRRLPTTIIVFSLELPVTKCGAYRLTARYRRAGTGGWWWHNDFAPVPGAALQRDCAIVVSPAKAAQVRLYEANALTVEATKGARTRTAARSTTSCRSTTSTGSTPSSSSYVREELGFNALWLMPVFPITRWRWDWQQWQWAATTIPAARTRPATTGASIPGSRTTARASARWSCSSKLVSEAHRQRLDVFIDAAFNHAGRDVVYGAERWSWDCARPSEAELVDPRGAPDLVHARQRVP